ncbi:unnamed protein product [Moneuplotes crassus]|uniref:Kinesin-like protein n=1 Tax=Euplotes crassus TaxID=5936 RepID=A0AAD2D6I6_EUPCR|nr:unnamed protein product [Moneuplotes crassus]
MSKASEFLKNIKRPKSGLTHSLRDDASYFSELAEEETDNHVKGLQSGEANIMVAVRVRPISKTEQKKELYPIVKVMDDKFIVVQDPSTTHGDGDFASNQASGGVKEKQYAFDYVFDENTEQKIVFDKTTQILLEGVLDGYNATVFAYGATGAGKTYTMLGTPSDKGIFGNAFEELFKQMEESSKDKDFKIKMSFIEIYNEMIFDLLLQNEKPLELREDATKGIHVAGISEVRAESTTEVLELLHLGNQNRSTEATDANNESSRSHALLLVTVEHKERDSGTEAEVKVGKFSLIDLAGSERASNTNNTGIRLVEGANINRSLLALGNCITLLYQNSEKKSKKYIPFRDSKLTRLLKDSLGGNSRTVMIANVSPCNTAYEETSNTLKYASRAKNIKTDVKRNVLSVSFHVSKYQSIINSLKKQVNQLKEELVTQELDSSMSKPPKNDKDTKAFDQLRKEMEENHQKEVENRKNYQENERILIESRIKLNNAWNGLKKYREKLPQLIKKKKIKDLHLAMIQVTSQNHTTIIENINLKNQEEIEQGKAKAKDMELKYLQELLTVRDEVISQTKKQLQLSKMELIIEQETLETAEDIQKRMKMSFPSITYTNAGLGNSNKNRNRSVNVRIENRGAHDSTSEASIPTGVGSTKHIASTLKLANPVIRKNNYIKSNLRYLNTPKRNPGLSRSKNNHSLPKLSMRSLDRPQLNKKESLVVGRHPKKPYLKIKGTKKIFERVSSPGGTSTVSDRTTTSLPRIVRSDTETISTKQPIPFKSAIKQMKTKIKAKDRMRLDRFKKENFLYSAAPKKLSLAEKYKPIAPPAPVGNPNPPTNFLSKFRTTAAAQNIVKKEEKKGDSSIPNLSYSQRMRDNVSKLNIFSGPGDAVSRTPLKGILKKKDPPTGAVNSLNDMNLRANTLANAQSRKFY